jgi:glycosyltransferase involved in cell wall biosynthesis
MRVLLVSSASYDPPRGGSTRSNMVWLAHLASAGHACRVVSGLPVDEPGLEHESEVSGVSIRAVSDARRRETIRQEIHAFQPDWVLVSSEDLSHTLLREAHRDAGDRVVYLAHTPQFYPFGPAAWNPDREATALVKSSAGVVAIAEFTAEYIRKYAGCNAVVIHPPIYGQPPFARLSAFGEGAVAMINPCAMKGISIFLSLARLFPKVPFAALPGWGTSQADRRALESLPNFRWLEPCREIEQMLRQTRLLLMPSLWLEGFGLIVVEAMLRGIPVLASDEGGMRESKLGTRYSLPVRPIREFTGQFDDRHMPIPSVPEQDIAPWATALKSLLNDSSEYEKECHASKQVAELFVSALRPEAFEHFLQNLNANETGVRGPGQSGLSSEKRELLLRRLRSRVKG